MNQELKKSLDELAHLVSHMSVPSHKKKNPLWLSKHLAERNKDHPNYEKAMSLVEHLLSHGVAHD